MKRKLAALVALLVLSSLSTFSSALASGANAEEWKGDPGNSEFDVGALLGMGVVDSQAGFATLITGAKKLVQHGFVPDINDSVSIETELGPVFIQGTAVFAYSFHLRWDFNKNREWTVFALGGLSGDITSSSLGSRFIVFPRFGVGAIYHLSDFVGLRGEVSRELIAVGVSLFF